MILFARLELRKIPPGIERHLINKKYVPMTSTRDKLNETRYFLECMKASSFHVDAFRYNLSAFLSAARSVTFVMQKEFSSIAGFNGWYATQVEEMSKDKFMKYLDRQRDIVIHERPVRSHPHVSVIEEISNEGDRELVALFHLMGTSAALNVVQSRPLVASAKVTGKNRCYFDDILDEDVITLCEKHVVKLENIVNGCEFQFKASS